MVPSAGKHILLRTGTAEIPSQYALQPRGHVKIPAPAPVSALRKKHCAAQAEYGRLAAQAYSPSDAMSQARVLSGGCEKGSTPRPLSGPGNPSAETAGLRRAYLFAEGGVVHADFPAVGDLAA